MSGIVPPSGQELARIEAILAGFSGLVMGGLSFVPAGELVAILRNTVSPRLGKTLVEIVDAAVVAFPFSGWTDAIALNVLLEWRRMGVFASTMPQGGTYPDDLRWSVNANMVKQNPMTRPFAPLNTRGLIIVPFNAHPVIVGGTSVVWDANVPCNIQQ